MDADSISPFELVTASKLDAKDAVALWCDDNRLDRVKGKENCFINGHRGTGKSMLFRILQHDCQELLQPSVEPDFLAVYFSVRDTEFLTEELELFQNDSQKNLISESHFSLLLLKQLFLLLRSYESLVSEPQRLDFQELTISCFRNAFQFSNDSAPTFEGSPYVSFLNTVISTLEKERLRIVGYIGQRLYERITFNGPLFLFDTLLGPIGDFFKQQLGKILYLLIDDGDDLPESHTIVLNSWIARRRASVVFKVSTMFGYKTFQTRTRSAIQHPHDFFQYDIATRHLSNSTEDYVELLRNICEKRLGLSGIEVSPDEFFPEDLGQRERLDKLESILHEKYSKRYSGRAVRDNVYRHLTSEYVQQLLKSRSSGDYVYSGFGTIAILSSGLVRDFILCAQRMYENAARKEKNVTSIPSAIQNDIVRLHADRVLEEISSPHQKRFRDATSKDWRDIDRLIRGLGTTYKNKFLSKDSERRVFSFAFQDEPGEELERLLDLAVAEGYLMKGFISRKEGTGRRTLYVLTRRVAPAFTLDVSSYSGYLSLTSDRIRRLLEHGAERTEGESPQQLDFLKEDEWAIISPEQAGL